MSQAKKSRIDNVLVLSIFAIVLTVGIYSIAHRFLTDESPEALALPSQPTGKDDHIRGTRSAPIQMIVYADFECKYCKRFHLQMLPEIEKQYGSEVVVVYRNFPMPSRSKALPEAFAAECAAHIGGEERYWDFVDILYRNTPSDNGFELARLPDLAAQAGLDVAAFEECRDSKTTEAKVFADMRDGAHAGVQIVPTFVFMRGSESVVMPGYFPQKLRAAIESFKNIKGE